MHGPLLKVPRLFVFDALGVDALLVLFHLLIYFTFVHTSTGITWTASTCPPSGHQWLWRPYTRQEFWKAGFKNNRSSQTELKKTASAILTCHSGSDLLLTDSCLLGFTAPQAGPVASTCNACHRVLVDTPFFVRLQECDDGAAAIAKARGLGLELHPAIVGGASFTHKRRDRNFLSILKDVWFNDFQYSSITLVWAGNDLLSWSTSDTVTQAVAELLMFGERYGIPIRLVDVVGEQYRQY